MLKATKLKSAHSLGEVSERPKEHAWKVCIPHGIEGSNPSLSANTKPRYKRGFLLAKREGKKNPPVRQNRLERFWSQQQSAGAPQGAGAWMA